MRESEKASRLACRPAREEDCRLLWMWANDPEVRGASFSPAPIPWDEHVAWFRRILGDPESCIFMIVDEGGTPVGVVRFAPGRDPAVAVSVTIAPEMRGAGCGGPALALAVREFLRADGGRRPVIAEIKQWNRASLKAFRSAGFVCRGWRKHDGEPVYILTHRDAPDPPDLSFER